MLFAIGISNKAVSLPEKRNVANVAPLSDAEVNQIPAKTEDTGEQLAVVQSSNDEKTSNIGLVVIALVALLVVAIAIVVTTSL